MLSLKIFRNVIKSLFFNPFHVIFPIKLDDFGVQVILKVRSVDPYPKQKLIL